MNQANYTDLPLTKLEENKGQIPGLPANPRKVSKDKLDTLKESITAHPEMLRYRGLMVYPHGEKYIVIGGNMRLKALRALKHKTAPCIILPPDTTTDQLKDYTLLDNAQMGEWDIDAILDDWGTDLFSKWSIDLLDNAQMGEWDIDAILDDWGTDLFSKWSIDLPEMPLDTVDEKDLEAKDDGFVEPPIESVQTNIKHGDLFLIEGGGLSHRLLCGDSTSKDDLKKLMGGGLADLVLTDPPYNVNYSNSTQAKKSKTRKENHIANDNMAPKLFKDFLLKAFGAMHQYTKPGGCIYCWYAASEGVNFRSAIQESGFYISSTLVWVKNSIILGWGDYQNKYEPCLYGWKEGDTHYFTLDRSNSTVIEDAQNFSKMTTQQLRSTIKQLLKELSNGTDIIRVDKPMSNDLHPTMKPVELFGYLIKNSTKQEWKVLDPFSGSGTTLVASHQLRRNGYALEYSPEYCQIILDRMQMLDPTIKVTKL